MKQTTSLIINAKNATEYWKAYGLNQVTENHIKASVKTQLFPLTIAFISIIDGTIFTLCGEEKIILFENGVEDKNKDFKDQIRKGWFNRVFAPAASKSKRFEHLFTEKDAKSMNADLDSLLSALKLIHVALSCKFNYHYIDNRLNGDNTIFFSVKPFSWVLKKESVNQTAIV